ncbi:biotin--[acetyl-CoA-carboxylase] ligase [Winogradskyella marincola]|uniref:Biotin--[acetyl-CoA-carboxylase] ligase n=1 Tax=Winogradskyella marincola TaxID=3037795 RepID=A0ABT6G4K5_9FLAO|nr:biotin--[acetyl-CoA-carboxylase] ligase [Winogradskyella sp. YYF002]MDG4716976.1 biotin--[acetyl-CoA-carboxylase] ligase [Winogradskyella sp. YYF002]
MYIIKLNAIDSTNSYLKAMASVNLPKDFTVVVADHQTQGRGQMGTTWQTEDGKNLTASVFKAFGFVDVEKQFYISMAVALSICKALDILKISQLSIKWPNDILSANKKICGTLIENVIKQNQLKGSIIGFGLNVNQKYFDNLPKASSMSLLTGVVYNKDEVLSQILKQLQYYFAILESKDYEKLKVEYESLLFRKDKPSTFKNEDGTTFSGIIKGITETGKLNVWTEDDVIKTFDLKQVTLLY